MCKLFKSLSLQFTALGFSNRVRVTETQAYLAGIGAAACLALTAHAQTLATLTDIGAPAPVPGVDDAYQLTTGAGNPDGLNYYFDNNPPPGQTFTTGSDPNGYVLTTLTIGTAGNSGGIPAAGQTYLLRIYSVSGTSATLLKSYISQSGFLFSDLDWLHWSGLNVALPANAQYAYTFARTSSGWENLASVAGNLYTGGEVALIPAAGGGITFGSSHSYDAAFDVGLTVASSIVANPPTVSPSSGVLRGTPVTLSVMAVGPSLSYQWKTDGGTGGTLTNIPGASGATLAVDTTGLPAGSVYRYDVVITNNTQTVTSAALTLSIYSEAGATLTDLGETVTSGPNDISQYIGGGNGDGLNYYDDNGANNGLWAGQTFTTGTNSQGYYLTSVAIQTGGGSDSGTGTLQPYELFIYSVTNGNAALLAHYTNASFNFTFGDWLGWSGFSYTLKPNTTYAYAFGRSAVGGTGWAALNSSPTSTDLYTGGKLCVIPRSGGAITFGTTGNSDGVFDVGLLPIGVGPSPVPFANPIAVSPSRTVVVGSQVTLNEAATGAEPLHYFWRTDGGSGTLTNISSSDSSNLVVNTTGWVPGAYLYAVVVSNVFGMSTSAPTTLTVVYANTTAMLTEVGASIPTPAANDISQLTAATAANFPDDLNYYFDNSAPPGQTFKTGSNPGGYTLSSVAIKLAGDAGSLPAGGQPYVLRLYSVSGGNAVLYAIFTSQTNFEIQTATDWLRWSGFALPLAPNTTYAYTFARLSTGSGWGNLSNVSGNPYSDGEVVLIPVNGGAMTTGSSHAYDGTFVIGLTLAGYPVVSPAMISPSNTVYAATPITLSATATGSGSLTYQWLSDGGSGGALTPISGATTPTVILSTKGLDNLAVAYALQATASGSTTVGEMALLTVLPESAPFMTVDTRPASAMRLVGASVTFSAAFEGTLPLTYQWQVDKGTGATNIVGQTNVTLVLTNLALTDAGIYGLFVTNSVGSSSSSPAQLTVVPLPAAPFTVNYQWHSTEGGDAGNYSGPGIPGYGSGTMWNQVIGPTDWNPGTFTCTAGYTDDSAIDTGYSWTLVTGGSWGWGKTGIALLDSAASAYSVRTFTFSNLVSGVYNLVLFSCNGSESSTADAAALFKVGGMSRVAAPTQDTSFVEGNNYVVFSQVPVTGSTLTGTWEPTNGKSYGSLNGAQLRYLGPAVTIDLRRVGTQLQLEWSQGTLLEATSIMGPWTTNSAPSPYPVTPTGPQKFYRVIVK